MCVGMKMYRYSFDFDIPNNENLITTIKELEDSYDADAIREQIANDIKNIKFEDFRISAIIEDGENLTQFDLIVCERNSKTINIVIEETLLKILINIEEFLDLDKDFLKKNNFTLEFIDICRFKLISCEIKNGKLILIVDNFIEKSGLTQSISIERDIN